jgi:hypothetical protein
LSDFLTILRSPRGRPPTKTIGPDGAGGLMVVQQYPRITWWTGEHVEFNGFDQLADLLEQLSAACDCIVVRGGILEGVDRSNMRRATVTDPTLDDTTAHLWLAIDIDKLRLPDGFKPLADPDATVRYAIGETLPPEFHNASCWWQLSSSAGLSLTLSMRLWFLLDRKLATRELKLWLAACPKQLDRAIFGNAQAIYIAAPVIAAGGRDPLRGRPRTGIYRRERDAVAVPEIKEPEREQRAGGGKKSIFRSASFEQALASIGDHDGGKGCHAALSHCVGWYFGRYGGDADAETLKAAIRERAAEAFWNKDHSRAYVADEVGAGLDRMVESIQGSQRAKEKREREERERAARRWPDEGLPLREAEHTLREAIDHFFGAAVPRTKQPTTTDDLFEFPQLAIRTTPGTGKTIAANAAMVKAIDHGITTGHAIPTHVKAEEIERFVNRMAGKKVARVWRGMDRDDPDAPGETMCRRAEAVKELRKAGGKRTDLCGKGRNICPFFGKCGCHKQEAAEPAIWILPHASLEHEPPAALRRLDALVIDEGLGPLQVSGLWETARLGCVGRRDPTPRASGSMG